MDTRFAPRGPRVDQTIAIALVLAGAACPTPAHADPSVVGPSGTSQPSLVETSAKPNPTPRFVLPFQLRPVIAKTLVRDDLVASTHAGGSTVANVTTLSYSFLPNVAALARVPYVSNTPKTGPHGTAFGNPLLGGLYTPALRPTTRLSLFAGVAFPFGQGGGNTPDKAKASAEAAAIYGRAAMDNALWVADYGVGTGGVGLAQVVGLCTGQLEATLLHLVRMRAENAQKDASRTNLTAGLMAGCYVLPPLQMIGELRYQRWLSTPTVVTLDDSKRDQATAGFGLRFDVRAGAIMLRPGLLAAMPLDSPMKKADYRQVVIDLPIVF